MAVYTSVSATDLETFVSRFDIGAPESLEPIAEGIENSNFLLRTDGGRYILTLFEARVAEPDLPFYLSLMEHLAAAGVPCPVPLRDYDGQTLHRLSGRPAALVTFLDGDWPRAPSLEDCREAGAALARLHTAGASFPMRRENDLSLPAWRPLFEPLAGHADSLRNGLGDWIADELSALEAVWPSGLPKGVIHADLFPDNVFFRDGCLSGIIDLYFACTDALAYDFAVTLNAWCFTPNGAFQPDLAGAMTAGYETIRRFEPTERAALPTLARGAAMRFLLTRLHDWFRDTDAHALTRRKDPLAFVPLIEFHRGVGDSAAGG